MLTSKQPWKCQRTNKTYVVDTGLEDSWLEALNGFDHLYLHSVCEGHLDGTRWASRKSMPVLRLSIEPSLFERLQAEQRSPEPQIMALFTASALRETTNIQHGWSDILPNDYSIHLDAKQDRASDDMEPWVREWFSDAIVFLRHVDCHLSMEMKRVSGAQV